MTSASDESADVCTWDDTGAIVKPITRFGNPAVLSVSCRVLIFVGKFTYRRAHLTILQSVAMPLSAHEKAAQNRRTPKPGGHSSAFVVAIAFWSAVLRRFLRGNEDKNE